MVNMTNLVTNLCVAMSAGIESIRLILIASLALSITVGHVQPAHSLTNA